MSELREVFANNLLPIFFMAAIGFGLQRTYQFEKQMLSKLVFNGLTPCLVFTSLIQTDLPVAELGRLIGFTLLMLLLMGAISWLIGWGNRFSRIDRLTLMLLAIFVNAGNYGLVLATLRYGADGVSRAIPYFLMTSITVYTVGVFIASMGHLSVRGAMGQLSKQPVIYAVIGALLVRAIGLSIPESLWSGLLLGAQGAIPVLLLLLGAQVADLDQLVDWRMISWTVVLRLLIAPILAIGLAKLVQLEGVGLAVSVLQASMPTAVVTIALATEFDLQPQVVTSAVVVTTLLSPISLTFVIYGLQYFF